MIGGLKKTTSRFAIAAAAGIFAGGLALTPAQAADLGGDCCADLEERVAELEATTVRKGNRKVSVKISGQINYVMLYWDDGGESDVYIGDNIESSTRFRFTGAAKFKPGWSAGFLLEIQTFSAASSAFDQKRDGDPNENADGSLSMRKAAWYIKSDRLGEIWMGRYSPATDDIKLLNIAGTPNVDASLETGGGFFLRAPSGTGGCAGSGCLYNFTLGSIAPGGDTRRGEVIRYNTPSLIGLVFSVSWGEDDIFDVAVRYKKQWNSIRVVGGIGYHWDTDEDEDTIMLTCNNAALQDSSINAAIGADGSRGIPTGIANPQLMAASSLNSPCRDYHFDLERLAGSFSAMHTPSGLYGYVGAHRDKWNSFSSYDDNGTILAANIRQNRQGGGPTEPEEGKHWYVQLGIKRRMLFRELGATTAYVEYQEWDGFREGTCGLGGQFTCTSPFGFSNVTAGGPFNAVSPGNGNGAMITESEVTSYGFGVVQNIDKAAMQVWMGFRWYEPEVVTQTVLNSALNDNLPTTLLTVKHRIEDIFHAQVGGKLKF